MHGDVRQVVRRVPTAKGPVQDVPTTSATGWVEDLAVDSTSVHFVGGGGKVWRAAK